MSLYLFLFLSLSLPYNRTDFGQYISARIKFRVPILVAQKRFKNRPQPNFLFFLVLSLSTTDFCFLPFDDRNKGRKNGGKYKSVHI